MVSFAEIHHGKPSVTFEAGNYTQMTKKYSVKVADSLEKIITMLIALQSLYRLTGKTLK